MSYSEDKLVPYSTWRHVKTNSTYTVLGIVESSTNGRENERYVEYISHTYQTKKVREISEFLDGRFEPIEKYTTAVISPRYNSL